MEQLSSIVFIMSLAFVFIVIPANGEFILKSPVVTNYGSWDDSKWENCPEGTFVKAIDLEYSPSNGENQPPPEGDGPDTEDDYGLVSISIECVSPYATKGTPGTVKTTGDSSRPHTAPLSTACEGFAIGFQLLSDEPQIALDNTAANNLRLYCSGLREGQTQYVEGNGDYTGEWSQPQYCKERQAVCGINSQVQSSSGPDNTGINNILVKCCDIPSPATLCQPKERWELIQECDNILGKSPIQCTFYRTVGLGTTTGFDPTATGHSLAEEYYMDSALGFNINTEYGSSIPFWLMHDLANKFKQLGDGTDATGQNWTTITTEMWNVETSTLVNYEVKEGFRAEIYQVVGSCSYFSVKTPRIKKIDKDKFNQAGP